jgi:UDP-N-acetylglucosamine--N-acetylmuramyl-(pentapeptide) pyrophosphoryl-undecaprenol N-acetylglucosamine transferase
MERKLVAGSGMKTYFTPMAPPASLRGILLGIATLRSMLVVLRTRPRVTFGTGGYVSVPAAVASWLFRVPVVLFLPDVVPGKAVSRLIPLTSKIAVTTSDSLRYLPANKTVVTGYPVRDEFLTASRESGRRRFNVPGDATLLLVTGGSLGARSLNEAVAACLLWLLRGTYVIHVCGQDRLQEVRDGIQSLPADLQTRYRLFPYLESGDMAAALAAADLCLCRSGASTLGELPATGTPAVLVPLPIAGVNQRQNAEYLVAGGAAVMLDNDDLTERLAPVLETLLADRERLDGMSVAARSLARPDASAAIARLILETAR